MVEIAQESILSLFSENADNNGCHLSKAAIETIKSYISSINVELVSARTKTGGNKIEGYKEEIARLTKHIEQNPSDFKAILELKRAKANISSLQSRKNSLNKTDEKDTKVEEKTENNVIIENAVTESSEIKVQSEPKLAESKPAKDSKPAKKK